MMDYRTMKSVLEGLLLVSGDEGLPLKTAADILETDPGVVRDVLDDLAQDYIREGRGFRVAEVAGGFRLTTVPEHAPYFEKLAVSPNRSALSQAALETLAIIAYKQPITRSEIEEIRGVKCEKALNTLLSKQLIREAGRAEGIGRPILYATTREFLEHFGLRELSDLPEPPVNLDLDEVRQEASALFKISRDLAAPAAEEEQD